MRPPLRLSIASFALTLTASVAFAQGELLTLDGPGSQGPFPLARFGLSVDGGGDVDGDGRTDIVVGDPWRRTSSPETGRGAVEVRSGVDGSTLVSLVDAPLLELLGGQVANAGDVDGDGVADALLTATDFGAGTVQVVSGADGAELHLLRDLGSVVAGLGDIDDDGRSEFLVANPSASIVHVVSGATGQTLWSLQGVLGERFGADVDGGSDLDVDGVPDLLVVSHPAGMPPRVQGYSGASGGLIRDVSGFGASGSATWRVRFVGTLDADGVPDFALGEPDVDTISVYSGASAALLFRRFGAEASRFGNDLAGVADVNDDGHGDLLVGAPSAGFFGFEGEFRVYSGIDGATLLTKTFTGDGERGSSVAAAGDVDGDGLDDFAIGVPYADNGNGGEIQIFSSATTNLIATFGTDFSGFLGMTMRGMGDLDNDGEPELVVGNAWSVYAGEHAGRASFLSPATSTERHFDGTPRRGLGEAVAFVGDVDGDGLDDFAVGLTNSSTNGDIEGAVEVRSGVDGSLLLDLRGSTPRSDFGGALAAAGDVDNDGRADIAVGAPLAKDGQGASVGAVQVFSGFDGSLLFERPGTGAIEMYGAALDAGTDFDGDLVPDLLVGAPLADAWHGRVEVLSGVDGALLDSKSGVANQRLGLGVSWLGEVTGDAVPDFIAGGRATPPGVRSRIQVLSGSDLSLVFEYESPLLQFYEASACAIGDVSGDGIPEVAIGLPDEDLNGDRSGLVLILSGDDGRVLAEYVGPGAGATFGGRLAAGGDVNGDGRLDFVVSAPEEGSVGTVRVFDGTCLRAAPYCTSNPHSGGLSATMQAEGLTSIAHNEFKLVAVDGPPGKFGVFFYGPTQINTAFGDGRRCVGGNTKRLQPAVQFDGAGRLERQLDFTVGPLASGSGAVTPGSTWNFQCWFRDPMSPGGSGFNLTDGLSVVFCP